VIHNGSRLPRMTATAEARQLTTQGARTRERILEAAAGLIHDQGVAATSMDDVRRAAKVSSSQIYHYFRDKRALVHAIVSYQAEQVVDGWAPMLARLDSVDGFRAWRNLVVRQQRQRGGAGGSPLGAIGAELADSDPEAASAVAAGLGLLESAFRAGLRAMREHGELPPEADPATLAAAALAALEGGLLLSRLRRDTAPLEAALDTFAEHLETLAERAI
jgi:TetR/AcrR family transcriptional repressor of nem operon